MNFDIVIDESSAHYFLHELDLMRLSEYEFLFPKTDGGDTYTIPIWWKLELFVTYTTKDFLLKNALSTCMYLCVIFIKIINNLLNTFFVIKKSIATGNNQLCSVIVWKRHLNCFTLFFFSGCLLLELRPLPRGLRGDDRGHVPAVPAWLRPQSLQGPVSPHGRRAVGLGVRLGLLPGPTLFNRNLCYNSGKAPKKQISHWHTRRF